jgi:hypothetical protein
MTKDEFEQLIFTCKGGLRLAKYFSQLTEKQRKHLSTHTNSLRLQIVREKPNKDTSTFATNHIEKIKKTGHWSALAYKNILVAAYAMCPLSTIKKIGDAINWERRKTIHAVISDRQPIWLDEWLEYDLNKDFSISSFGIIRHWMQLELCKKPTSNGYTHEFVSAMYEDNRKSKSEDYLTISARIKADPSLLVDLYPLFYTEHDAFTYNYIYYDYDEPEKDEFFLDAIINFIDESLLDKNKIIKLIIEGLQHDIKQNQLSSMHKLHDRLKPENDVLILHENSYLELLAHNVGHIQKFALKILTKLQRAKKLSQSKFLSEVNTIFFQEAKGNAISAIKLISIIIKTNNTYFQEVIASLCQALQHPNVDVQELALKTLTSVKSSFTENDRDSINSIVDYINPSLRTQLMELLGNRAIETKKEANSPIVDITILQNKLSKLSKSNLVNLGLKQIDLKADNLGPLQAISPKFVFRSQLEQCEEIVPINDLDTLVQVISTAIEGMDDTNDFERILDGLSRLCDQKDKDFYKKTAPLLNRLEKGFDIANSLVQFYGGIRVSILGLLFCWLKGANPTKRSYFKLELEKLEPLAGRLKALQTRVLANQSQILFSTPTHENGWISPEIWIQRIKTFQQTNIELDSLDFCTSLLRLMPTPTKQDLREAKSLTGVLGRIACFMMGYEDINLTKKDIEYQSLWITAVKCKNPNKDWTDKFTELNLNKEISSTLKPIQFKTHIYIKKQDGYKFPQIDVSTWADSIHINQPRKQNLFKKISRIISNNTQQSWKEMPTLAIYRHENQAYAWNSQLNTEWISQWLFSLWPANLEPIHAVAIEQVAHRLDQKSSSMETVFGFFQGLYQSHIVFSPMAHTLLSLGLIVKDKDANYAAIDAFIDGVDNCKINEDHIINSLDQLIKAEFVVFNRLADSFNQIHPVSQLHAYCISQIIQGLICRMNLKLRNLFKLLEVLLEIQIELNCSLSDDCVSVLSSITGSNKLAKTAKKLTQLEGHDKQIARNIKLSIIENRINLITG